MKLTSKSLFAVSVAGLFAGSAMANTDYVYDTFEIETNQTWQSTYDWWNSGADDNHGKNPLYPTNGMPLTNFRRQQEQGWVTSDGPWTSSGASDQSIITNAAVDFSAAATRASGAKLSVPGEAGAAGASTSQQYVVLDTQGDTVSRSFTSQTLGATSLYVDTMIQFTASEDFTATGLSGARLALWVNKNTTEQFAAGDLVVYARGLVYEGGEATGFDQDGGNYVIAHNIDPEKWYRLTIQMFSDSGDNYFCVRLDGELLSSDNAASDEELFEGTETTKCWFSTLGSGQQTVSEVAFQGTGAIDNLVVTDYEPSFEGSSVGAFITLTWTGADHIGSVIQVTDSGATTNSLSTGDTVGAGDTVTIATADWYGYAESNLTTWATAAAAYGTPGSITVTPEGADENIKTVTFTIIDVTQEGTVALPAAELYSNGSTTVGDKTVNAAKAAAWATANQIGENAQAFAAVYDQYLLNIDATATDPALVIDSIEKTETGLKITVSKAYTAANAETETVADLGEVNGTIVIRTADTLAGLNTAEDTEVQATVVDGKSTITVETDDEAQFVKVWVK